MKSEDRYFLFLDGLPKAHVTGGMGAGQKLQSAFPELSHSEASQIVVHWLEALPDRYVDDDE